MIVIFGFGMHAKEILRTRCVFEKDINVIVDESISKKGAATVGSIPIISWATFENEWSSYKRCEKFIIGTERYYDEIKEILLGYQVDEKKICYIDEWAKQYPEVNNLIAYHCQEPTESGMELYTDFVENCLDIPEEALEPCKLLVDRDAALKRIPQGGIVAEIGVAFGDFSRKILDELKPRKFYAVDIFADTTLGIWNDMRFKEHHVTHEQYYKLRFEKEIKENLVCVRKGLSWECMQEFQDDYFDYIYLDAAHDYESVSKDVNVILKKIKNGGIIQFNDYIAYDYIANEQYGVVPVVHQLLKDTSSKVVFFCLEKGGFHDIVVKVQKNKISNKELF